MDTGYYLCITVMCIQHRKRNDSLRKLNWVIRENKKTTEDLYLKMQASSRYVKQMRRVTDSKSISRY